MFSFNGVTSYDNYHYFWSNFPSEAALTQINASQCWFLWSCNIRNWQLEILIGPVTENIMTAHSDLFYLTLCLIQREILISLLEKKKLWVDEWGRSARERPFIWKEITTSCRAVIKLGFKCWSWMTDTKGLHAYLNCQPFSVPVITNGSRHRMQHGRLPTSDWLEALLQRPPDSCQTDWRLIITDLVQSPVTLTQRQNVPYNTTQIV